MSTEIGWKLVEAMLQNNSNTDIYLDITERYRICLSVSLEYNNLA